MGKRLFLLLMFAAAGIYLHFVRGWDLETLRSQTLDKVPFLAREAPAGPIGSRGAGTHWETAKPMPIPRAYAGAALIGGKIYVVGGLDGYGRTLRNVHVYDIEKDAWSETPLMPQALHHAAVATDGQKLYVMGGFPGLNAQPADAAYAYSPEGRSWAEIEHFNDFRGAGAGASAGGRIWFIGGVTLTGPSNAVAAYDAQTNRWNDMPKMSLPRRDLATAVVGDRIYAFGGREDGLGHTLDVVESYDSRTRDWSTLPAMPHHRSGIAAASVDDQVFVFGGQNDKGTFPEIDVFDTGRKKWKSYGLALPTARHGLVAVPYKNRIYVIGGGRRPGFSVSDKNEVLILDTKLLGWSEKKAEQVLQEKK